MKLNKIIIFNYFVILIYIYIDKLIYIKYIFNINVVLFQDSKSY